ncbi:hypothetical protein JMK10_19365 [Rhodovulum sulfidophilum]|uniref:hypothetical protein n=1 Tax=Rhodovulum sulfidophilum TaxID=35806 RepID=UPI0019210562|nr:hypothetical protein [Rhodovulum sulfidophilum]MBL3576380.1 hypothetical protein [Rhodovulum sulfidophilum]MCF4118887.1 hypothetical protein [Rhodovulum sulfidophilum]
MAHTKMSRIAAFFTEAEALVSALEDSHLDDEFSTSKTYEVVFETPAGPSRLALAEGRKIEKYRNVPLPKIKFWNDCATSPAMTLEMIQMSGETGWKFGKQSRH